MQATSSQDDMEIDSRDVPVPTEVVPFMAINVQIGTLQPYEKLILSDLEEQPRPDDTADDTHPTVKLFQDKIIHTCDLCGEGAKGPFYEISGFSSNKFISYDRIVFNNTVLQYGLVFWGSPHWGEIASDSSWKKWRDSAQFKTNSMESMSWLSPNALCLMTFSEHYKVEFWTPLFNNTDKPDNRIERKLEICQAFFRRYHPLASGSELHKIHTRRRVMVAMLVPDRFRHCVTFHNNNSCIVDVGATMLKTLEALGVDEWALELGGQTYSLSYEIHLARMERMNAIQLPPL